MEQYKLLFDVITGTEPMGFDDLMSNLRIKVYLEPVEDIILMDIGELQNDPNNEHSINHNTYTFYEMLSIGDINTVQSLFVDTQYAHDMHACYYEMRKHRQMFISQIYFNKILEFLKYAIKIKKPIFDGQVAIPGVSTEEDKTEFVQLAFNRKLLALSIGLNALLISQNQDVKHWSSIDPGIPELSFNSVDKKLRRCIKDLSNISEYKYGINRTLLMEILRADHV